MNPRILLVDDAPDVLQAYEDILGDHGFDTERAPSPEAALEALEKRGPWDVVLLDEKLRGAGGPWMASPMLVEIAARAPQARTIVITGFATPDAVRAALTAGAWDYLEKDARYLEMLLPVRVRHAVEAARERGLRGATAGELRAALLRTWAEASALGTDPHRKGRLLEETLLLLFRTMSGFERAEVNLRGEREEFDVVVPNESADPILAREGSWFLVECKNWSSPVGTQELNHLRAKLRDRFRRVQLGILVAIGGVTEGARSAVLAMNNEPQVVIVLERADVEGWIDSLDPVAWLKARLQATVLRARA